MRGGRYIKADIFDHPTAFALTESVAADPSEALCASLNKFGTVELSYMTSLLPDMEESDILAALEGRIFFNPLADAYEIADQFISGNVIEKAERIDAWLLDHPGYEAARPTTSSSSAAPPSSVSSPAALPASASSATTKASRAGERNKRTENSPAIPD